MKVKIKIFDETFVGVIPRRTTIAAIELPASHELAACTLIEFAESNFTLGSVDKPLDYYAGLRATFYALLSAHHIQGTVVVEAKISK